MKPTLLLLAALLLSPLGAPQAAEAPKPSITVKLTHRHGSSLGIDEKHPRLGWHILSTNSNILQTAYQIVVSTSAGEAFSGQGDVWDSGKVSSSDSFDVKYAGPALESTRRYYWSVKVWDNHGHVSGWSEPAWWEMGLLAPNDWSGAQWIAGATSPSVPLLRKDFLVGKKIETARLYISACGYYEASINGQRVGTAVLDPGFTAYNKRILYSTYDVTRQLKQGTNALGVSLGRGFYAMDTSRQILWWNSVPWLGKQPLLKTKLEITYTDQTRTTVVSDPSWVTHAGPASYDCLYRGESFDARLSIPGWDTPTCDTKDWVNVWVEGESDVVVTKALYGILDDPARTRDVTADVQRVVFDTEPLSVSTITAMGDPAPGVVKTLRVEYTINGQSHVASGIDFGLIPFEKPADASKTAGVKKVRPPSCSTTNLQAQTAEPIRATGVVTASSITEPKPGSFVFKFPVMMAGWPRLTVLGSAGATVRLRLGEKLKKDGTVDNMGDPGLTPGEIQCFDYTLSGQGTEVWEPKFSYAGFQYVQVDNFPGTPTTNSVVACEVHSDVPTTGTFFCSDPLLNKIHDLCKRAVLNNLHSVPTDSPMYEKRGWCDGLLWAAQAADNFGMQPFYSKWLNDIADTQRPNGDIAEVAPGVGGAMDLSWSSVIVVLPWHLYQEYGDRDAIAIHYDQIKRFVDYLSSKATNHLVTGFYGDWVSPGHVMPPEGPDLVACASYYRDVWLLSKMAAVLGRAADEVAYTQLAGEIKTAFNAKYLTASEGAYHTDKKVGYRQTSSAVPLDFGLVPPEHIGVVVSNLVSDVRSRDNHLNTGSFGTAALLPVLTENGQGELAYAVAAQTTFPSWGYWVSQGVTAACEQWTTGETLRSWDHAFLGSVDDWFFKYLAGIQPAKPGYKEINIRPFVPEGLQSASASITSPFGLVSSGWTQESNGVVILKVRVPPNTVAHVWVPGASSPVHVGSGQHTFGGKSSRMK